MVHIDFDPTGEPLFDECPLESDGIVLVIDVGQVVSKHRFRLSHTDIGTEETKTAGAQCTRIPETDTTDARPVALHYEVDSPHHFLELRLRQYPFQLGREVCAVAAGLSTDEGVALRTQNNGFFGIGRDKIVHC